MTCISVLLPDPFSPTRPTSSPRPTSNDAPRRTSTRRRRHGGPDEKDLVTPSTVSTDWLVATVEAMAVLLPVVGLVLRGTDARGRGGHAVRRGCGRAVAAIGQGRPDDEA